MKEEEFRNPRKEFRGVPFWSWNDKLEDRELVRQIGEMDEAGWGGFFMHARVGLVTPYLSKEWMDRVETCVKEAAKRGMGAWLYDENRWPSGFAGGIVPAQNEEYRSKAIYMWMSGRFDVVKEAVRIFKCDMRNGVPENIEPIAEREEENQGKTYLYFNLYTSPIGMKGFDGYSYIDVLNLEAVKAFIESTYEAYYKRVGKSFGSVVPGIFTDEPNFLPVPSSMFQFPNYALPWTNGLPGYFLDKKGYDVRDHLPSLFFNVGEYTKVRYDYWDTVTDLYVEAYSKHLYDWCTKHNLKFTGHYLLEDTLVSQLRAIGAAMPHYEYQHIPGIDHIGKNIAQPLTVKQVSSVAEQLGKERILTETLSFGGFTFEDRKWIGDWHYVLGANFLNLHLSLYSMRGERKRDCPPNLFYQQPWWKYNRLIDDYYARLSYALSGGKRTVDILVVHPISSAWTVYTPFNSSEAEKLNSSLEWLVDTLLELHRDFELGDEKIMKRYGSVEGSTLTVGRSSYRAVIVPSSKTISISTLNLLRDYVNNGGLLITIKPTFSLMEGCESNEVKELLNKAVIIEDRNEKSLLKALENFPVTVEINLKDGQPARKVWYHLREERDQQILFMANIDREEEYKTTIKIRGKGKMEEWNHFTGEIQTVPTRFEEGYSFVELYFPPVGSHLLVLRTKEELLFYKDSEKKLEKTGEITLSNKWRLKPLDMNALTLDHCRVKLDNDEYGERTPIWRVYASMKEKRLIGPIVSARIGSTFSVEYEFESDLKSIDNKRVYLVLESPEKYDIKVNGQKVQYRDIGYWIDTTFKKIDIKKLVKQGINTIEISGKVDFETEIENCYVVGDFGVEGANNKQFKLVEEKKELESGNAVNQGYPFFAGTISYSQEFKVSKVKRKAILRIEDLNAVVARIILNGKEAGHIFMKCHELDVTGFLKDGTNILEIQITNDLRNLGIQKMYLFQAPEEVRLRDTYYFVPYGMGKVRIRLFDSDT